MSGSIWIDDADREIARFEGRHDDSTRRGAALKGTGLKVEQTRVGEGLWMPASYEQMVATGNRTREIVSSSFFDFRKFDVESTFVPKIPPN